MKNTKRLKGSVCVLVRIRFEIVRIYTPVYCYSKRERDKIWKKSKVYPPTSPYRVVRDRVERVLALDRRHEDAVHGHTVQPVCDQPVLLTTRGRMIIIVVSLLYSLGKE